MANTTDPALTYTLTDFITMGTSDELTYREFSILEKIDDLELVDHNLLDDYISEMEDLTVSCELDDDQKKKYKYAPDLMAYDVYGSVQLDFVIMLMNGMVDPKEFTLTGSTITLMNKSVLLEFLNQVYNSNSGYIALNRKEIG